MFAKVTITMSHFKPDVFLRIYLQVAVGVLTVHLLTTFIFRKILDFMLLEFQISLSLFLSSPLELFECIIILPIFFSKILKALT